MPDKPNEHKTLRQKINNALDIPDVSKQASLIALRGRKEFSFCGRSVILLYTPSEIRLLTVGSVLSVKGSELVCSTYHKDETKIFGKIDSVSFIDEIPEAEK